MGFILKDDNKPFFYRWWVFLWTQKSSFYEANTGYMGVEIYDSRNFMQVNTKKKKDGKEDSCLTLSNI